ncbi:hypothetical protein CA54_56670 [Symmachiella macrocystis]|uniref:Zinc-ribbon domain-containing protein n=1 Tax=Symmachiella macrocystis TaxID=2527985 RepID=A0A5C6B6S9_9PLAN|nr:hypothetical protein [Symmachiella macrocystis]TWU07262.1 hypothetical protein CA54_56670 [Symmachiella macrocystis]
MRPCQHCGKAIQLSDTICPSCDGEQVASVGLGVAKAPASGVRNDHTLDQRQKEIQWYPESWSIRRLVIVTLSINAGLVLFGYLVGGTQGAGWAMSIVALLLVVPQLLRYFDGTFFLIALIPYLFLLIVLSPVFPKLKPELDLEFSLDLAALLLVVANGVGAFYCLLKLTP